MRLLNMDELLWIAGGAGQSGGCSGYVGPGEVTLINNNFNSISIADASGVNLIPTNWSLPPSQTTGSTNTPASQPNSTNLSQTQAFQATPPASSPGVVQQIANAYINSPIQYQPITVNTPPTTTGPGGHTQFQQ